MADRMHGSARSREYLDFSRSKTQEKFEDRRAHRFHFAEEEDSSGKNFSTPTIMSRPTTILSKPKEESKPSLSSDVDQKKASSDTTSCVRSVSAVYANQQSSSSLVPSKPAVSILSSVARSGRQKHGKEANAVINEVPPLMKASIRLVADNVEFTDFVTEYLSNANTNFVVIGAIGPQGTGKSTLLSMLAGNDHQDMYRHYVFRPASREAVESCRHQSNKINIYVTKSRIILLDCQAMYSPSILGDLMHYGRHSSNVKTVDHWHGSDKFSEEYEALRLTSFLLQVCHTILLCVDWFVDIDVIRHIRRSEMFRTTPQSYNPDTLEYRPNRRVNLVLVHQRAKSEDFYPSSINGRCKLLEKMFSDSKLDVKSGMSLGGMGFEAYRDISPEINYVPLTEIKPRPKNDLTLNGDSSPWRPFVVEYDVVLRAFRCKVLSLHRDPFTVGSQPFTETDWYEMATRVWRSTLKNYHIYKFCCAYDQSSAITSPI